MKIECSIFFDKVTPLWSPHRAYRSDFMRSLYVIYSQNSSNHSALFLYLKFGIGRTRTLPGANFVWLLLKHVLHRGFRRARDYVSVWWNDENHSDTF